MSKRLSLCLAMLIVVMTAITAQETIKGKVLDSQGNPVLGAKVEILGTDQYVITDPDGTFVIASQALPAQVRVSYVGMGARIMEATPEMTIYLRDRKQKKEKSWTPMVGVNVTFGDALNRPVYGLLAGSFNDSKGMGAYLRAAFLNHPYTEHSYYPNASLEHKHKFYAFALGGMMRVYKPLIVNLGVGCGIHDAKTEISYLSMYSVGRTSFDYASSEDGRIGNFLVDLGLGIKLSHFMLNGGTLFEIGSSPYNRWYPYVGLNYCF